MNLQQFVMDINARHYKEMEQTVIRSDCRTAQLSAQVRIQTASVGSSGMLPVLKTE